MKNTSTLLVILTFLVSILIIIYFQTPNLVYSNVRVHNSETSKTQTNITKVGSKEEVNFRPIENELIAPGTVKDTCLSRFEASLYRRTLPRKPSPYLISKLRAYEERHRRCGPNTEPYKRSIERLKSGDLSVTDPDTDCNYVVYLSSHGLGNRILTATASFLYGLLTDRVFLVHFGREVPEDLFCEPFLDASWSLPKDFPLAGQFSKVGRDYPETFGNMIIKKKISIDAPTRNQTAVAPYVYVYVLHDFTSSDKLFFCEDYHNRVKTVPWLVFSANNYFVPALFLMPSFEPELSRLFPERETVFHHLGRYLFSPSNSVWGMVKRYHQAYLAKADEIVGIQIRTFFGDGFFPHVMDQMLACVKKGNLLPQVVEGRDIISSNNSAPKRKAVLVTSLSSAYYERLKETYWRNPTRNGNVVGIFQPSHEEHQQTGKQDHNSKAWTEMYLLSLADVLVTSGRSTFGYVAQGLGGGRPWVAPQAYSGRVPNPPCSLTETLEPCLLSRLEHVCDANKTDPGLLVPYVKHCEDWSVGLKVF